MITAQFQIELPPGNWVQEISQSFPDATLRLLSGFPHEDRALELGEVIGDASTSVASAIRDHPEISAYERLETDERRVLAKYETNDTALYDFVGTATVTIEFPVTVHRGWFGFSLTGTEADLDRLRETLEASPLSYELESLHRSAPSNDVLTTRQRDVLETAVRRGYFKVPRECTLADLAADLAVDKSTVSTVLRRGEQRILTQFLD